MSKNQPTPRPSPGMPRWVKLFVVLFIVLILLVIVVHVMGFRFDHGTSRMLVGGLAHLNQHNALRL